MVLVGMCCVSCLQKPKTRVLVLIGVMPAELEERGREGHALKFDGSLKGGSYAGCYTRWLLSCGYCHFKLLVCTVYHSY
jgi:hypothetical protein